MRQNRNLPAPSKPNGISSTYRVEADQKDLILTKLRAEFDALKKNEQQFAMLKDQYADLDRKYRTQLQQKNLQDSDFKNRHDCALRHIGQLKTEVEACKNELRDRKIEIEDLKSDEDAIKTTLDQRNIEIEKLRMEINALAFDSEELQNERIALIHQVETLRKNNSAVSESILNLQKQEQTISNRLAELTKYYEQLQNESDILKEKIQSYEDTNNQLDHDIQETINQLADLDNQLYQAQSSIADFQGANAQLSSNADQFKSEASHHLKATQTEVMKNNDLMKRIKQSQNTLRIRSQQVKEGHEEIAALRAENESLDQINNNLNEDLEACRKHLENLGLLNRQLLTSLQNFSEEDRKAAEILNREHRVKYLGDRVQESSSMEGYWEKETARTDVSFSSSRRRLRG